MATKNTNTPTDTHTHGTCLFRMGQKKLINVFEKYYLIKPGKLKVCVAETSTKSLRYSFFFIVNDINIV